MSTRKLVDSTTEQEILEELVEGQKPPRPREEEFAGLHYLLYTPFRYPPLKHGSRFGTRTERSIWYGSEAPRTAFAEVAYYRLLFLAGTTAELEPVAVELSLFHVGIRTRRGVDLLARPFDTYRHQISSPSDYRSSQRLGREMRTDGVEAFRYTSARDRQGGVNVGLFSPRAFASRRPGRFQTWYCVATPSMVELSRLDFLRKERFDFPRSDFEVEGTLPAPAP